MRRTDRFVQRRAWFLRHLLSGRDHRSTVDVEPTNIGTVVIQSNEIPIVEAYERQRTAEEHEGKRGEAD